MTQAESENSIAILQALKEELKRLTVKRTNGKAAHSTETPTNTLHRDRMTTDVTSLTASGNDFFETLVGRETQGATGMGQNTTYRDPYCVVKFECKIPMEQRVGRAAACLLLVADSILRKGDFEAHDHGPLSMSYTPLRKVSSASSLHPYQGSTLHYGTAFCGTIRDDEDTVELVSFASNPSPAITITVCGRLFDVTCFGERSKKFATAHQIAGVTTDILTRIASEGGSVLPQSLLSHNTPSILGSRALSLFNVILVPDSTAESPHDVLKYMDSSPHRWKGKGLDMFVFSDGYIGLAGDKRLVDVHTLADISAGLHRVLVSEEEDNIGDRDALYQWLSGLQADCGQSWLAITIDELKTSLESGRLAASKPPPVPLDALSWLRPDDPYLPSSDPGVVVYNPCNAYDPNDSLKCGFFADHEMSLEDLEPWAPECVEVRRTDPETMRGVYKQSLLFEKRVAESSTGFLFVRFEDTGTLMMQKLAAGSCYSLYIPLVCYIAVKRLAEGGFLSYQLPDKQVLFNDFTSHEYSPPGAEEFLRSLKLEKDISTLCPEASRVLKAAHIDVIDNALMFDPEPVAPSDPLTVHIVEVPIWLSNSVCCTAQPSTFSHVSLHYTPAQGHTDMMLSGDQRYLGVYVTYLREAFRLLKKVIGERK